MKSAEEWVAEYSSSGPFDQIDSSELAVQVVREIQDDAQAQEVRELRRVVHTLAMELRIIATWANCDVMSGESREKVMADIAKLCHETLIFTGQNRSP